ncbi:MAG: EcsC family protein [Pseudonocardiaceae bacterium]
MRRDAILSAYRKRGHLVDSMEDIHRLGLQDVDAVMPRLDLAYVAATFAEGAAAGLAVSGGQITMAGGALPGAGAGAAPGAAVVVGAMAADAAVVLVASQRAVTHVAAYYGYDTDRPEEQLFALGVLGVGTAPELGKAAAYVELNKIVQGLARRQTWKQLNERTVTKIVSQVYTRLGMRLTLRKLGQAVR